MFFLRLGLDVFSKLMSRETFIRAYDRTGRPRPRTTSSLVSAELVWLSPGCEVTLSSILSRAFSLYPV